MGAQTETSRMKREIYEMPESVKAALKQREPTEKYRARPMYQQNDYVGWISRAKRPETQQKRIDQMLDELEAGGVYMKMRWSGEKD